jgi:hypothetical protein
MDMVNNMKESFFITRSWNTVRARMKKTAATRKEAPK